MDRNKFSFTLIELLIVISIISILSTVGLAYYNKYGEEVKLKNSANQLADVLELAKKKAESSELFQPCSDFLGYNVTVTTSYYLLRFNCGGSYQTVQSYNFPTNITAVSGTDYFNFKPLGLGTNITVNSIILKNTVINQCQDISISTIGVVDETLVTCP